jgi:hypothetical protein
LWIETKYLSVNNVNGEGGFSERDNGGGQMIECQEAAFELFVAHQELAEAIEPTVRDLNDPSSGALVRVTPNLCRLLASTFDMSNVSMGWGTSSAGAPV